MSAVATATALLKGQDDLRATILETNKSMEEHRKWVAETVRGAQMAFDRTVTNAIDQEEARVGKPLGYTERQGVIDRMMIDGKVSGAGFLGFGGGKHFYEVAGTPDAEKFAPKIPDLERKTIEAALTRAGRPVTTEEVVRLYKKKNGLQ